MNVFTNKTHAPVTKGWLDFADMRLRDMYIDGNLRLVEQKDDNGNNEFYRIAPLTTLLAVNPTDGVD
ncbi:MAG: hypothetical protein CMJ81_12730 [Planctomycetaceae bacterium]|jgi:hypothetical protein|nr:hypothetical protein [Planctomycetaceae bacterium]MBP62230.1 hypothetical protein [Planctomycetaceae bacterium]